mmetsp:Transcript_18883/g.49199  ORF Transcript_18883/g.49199 Transcript_18883/m.49199 type:complete len:233 (-) Transcript_18883:128-826(-)
MPLPPASASVALLDKAIGQLDAILGATTAQAVPKGSKGQAAPAKAAAPVPPPAQPAQQPAVTHEAHALYQKALLKVARVLEVEEVPNSDKLYKLAVDVGGEQRQVCAGLRQFVPREQLQGRLVVAVCNLKPAKLAGVASEAMLLAADREDASGRVVRMLEPPPGSQPGDQVFLEGGAPSTDAPKQVKGEVWKGVASALNVAKGHKASVAGVPLVTGKGAVTVPSDIPEGASI